MDGDTDNPSSYWLDACEDTGDFINIPEDFDPTASYTCVVPGNETNYTSDVVQGFLDPCFFSGIDGILESIQQGAGLPLPDAAEARQQGEIIFPSYQDSASFCPRTDADATASQLNSSNLQNSNTWWMTSERQPAGLENVNRSLDVDTNLSSSTHLPSGHGFIRHSGSAQHSFDNSYPEDRFSKRPCLYQQEHRNDNSQHQISGRGNYQYGIVRGRKRPRDWENFDRRDRDRDQVWRRGSGNGLSNGRKDFREVKGYWERDRSKGSCEMVFHTGSWEADQIRESKVPAVKCHTSDSTREEKKAGEPKEKIQVEHARQYQLDVLQQAETKNTIAFLETGAGKTLIAVLLIKSLFCQFQKLNKKFLAVFLVPKVPLVYQVMNTIVCYIK